MRKKTFVGKKVIMVLAIALALLVLVPFIWMVIVSFKTPPDILANRFSPIPQPFTWRNYERVLSENPLEIYYRNSALVTVAAIITILLFSSMAGFAFAKYKFPAKEVLFILILGTLIVPSSMTMIPLYLIMKSLRGIDTLWALVIPHIASAFGTFLLRQYIQTIPDDLLDAARIDGCSEFKIYWNIALPLCKPALIVLAVLAFNWSWNDFLWPLIIINSAQNRTIVLSIVTSGYLPRFMGNQWGPLMALSFFVMAPTVVFFTLLQRYVVRGISLTGIK